MKKIGVIVNPYAKKIRKKRIYLNDFYSFDKNIVLVRITTDVQEIDKIILEFKNEQVAYIGITGGDGTIHQILTRIIHLYGEDNVPCIVILKGGTMNLVSESLRVKGSAINVLQRLVNAIKDNKEIAIHERDTLKINDRYCFLFGLGVVTNYLNEVYKQEKGSLANIRGFFTAIEHSIHEPDEHSIFEGIHGETKIDNEPVPLHFISGILAGTVEYISPGMPALSKATKDPGKFHILLTDLTKFALLKHLYVVFGITSSNENIISAQVGNVVIQANAPFEYTMDGDIYKTEGELLITTGPRIKFVYV